MKTESAGDKYKFFVGIDWGVDAHVVCVLDPRRKILLRRVSATEVLSILREKPLHVAPGTAEAAWAHIELLLPRLELVRMQRRQLDRRKVRVDAPGVQQRRRNACYHWANVSMQREPRAKAAYASLRARGHSHGRALRSIADQDLRMLMAMLRAGVPFDPPRRVRGKRLLMRRREAPRRAGGGWGPASTRPPGGNGSASGGVHASRVRARSY